MRGGLLNEHHGIGLKLGRLMKELYGPSFNVLERIKKAIDPDNIMNPARWGSKRDNQALCPLRASTMLVSEHTPTIDAAVSASCRHVCTLGVERRESDTPRGKGLILFKVLTVMRTTRRNWSTLYRCCLCGMRGVVQGQFRRRPRCSPRGRYQAQNSWRPSARFAINAPDRNPFGLPAKRFQAIDTAGLSAIRPSRLLCGLRHGLTSGRKSPP